MTFPIFIGEPTEAPQPLSGGNSALSTTLTHLLTEMRRPPPSTIASESSQISNPTDQILKPFEATKEIRLFNIVAALKIAVAEVSMHLDAGWRTRLFAQIDLLHEPDDWDDGDKLANMESFKTFLHMILQNGPMQKLGLGIDDEGHILASWRNGRDMLSFIFLSNDRVRWAVVRHENDETESAGGETGLDRLPIVLRPYNPEVWYGNANNVSSS
jgi:hypothetical protein